MKKNILALLTTIWVTLIIVILSPYAYDDAYIHFRISENFGHYFLPYFNLSEHVMSTSSFVWTSVLAVLSRLPFSLLVKTSILNAVFVMIGSFTWSHLLSALSKKEAPYKIFFPFQLMYIGLLLPSAAGLMETPLAILLLGLSVLLLVKNRATGWILMGLAIFTRYEIIVFACLFLIIWFYYINGKKKLTGIVLFGTTTAFLQSIIYYFYSTVIPNTAIAKQVVYQITILDTFNGVLSNIFFWKPSLYLLLAIAILSFLRSQKATLFGCELWNGGIFGGGLIIALLYIIKQVFLQPWYAPLFSVPILFGVYWAALQPRILIRLTAATLFILPISNLYNYSYAAFVSPSVLPSLCSSIRVQRYLQVGSYLYDFYPNAKLLSSEIGGLGYSFQGEIIDAVGLVTPSALKYHPMRIPEQRGNGVIGAIPAKLVKDFSPELIVTYPVFAEEFSTSTYADNYKKITIPAFSKVYREKTNCKDLWGEDEMLNIYIRNDIVTNHIVSFLKRKLDN